MSNTLNWFESPLPKPSRHSPTRPLNDPDDHWSRSIDLPSPTHQLRFQHNPLSPWSRSLADPPVALALPPLPPPPRPQQLLFSDDEDELVTPVRQQLGKEREEGELHTTGRKSEGELLLSGKKSRPREKGLRKLSQRAYEIVIEMRNASYKEVAARLVQELNEDEFEGESKEEQNIKRRVYDALNVLIALGVLRKDGRKIVSRQHRDGKSADCTLLKKLQQLKKKIAFKQNVIQEKRDKLKEELIKYDKIAFLVKRNQQMDKQNTHRLQFPFIGINCTTDLTDDKEGEMNETGQIFSLRSIDLLQPFGDIDTLRFIKFKEASTTKVQTSWKKKTVEKKTSMEKGAVCAQVKFERGSENDEHELSDLLHF